MNPQSGFNSESARRMQGGELDDEVVHSVLAGTLQWSHEQGYRGHEKHDGLNSPALSKLCGRSSLLRLVAIQAVMRSPLNLRRWLRVRPALNPKGLALFIQSYLDLHQLDRDPRHLQRIDELVELLKQSRSPVSSLHGRGWGYWYPWQDPGFYAPAGTPNAVVTAFVCEALLDIVESTGQHQLLDMVADAIEFFFTDLKRLKDTEEELCLSYMPIAMTMRVMDVSILIASVVARYCKIREQSAHMDSARRLLRYVVRRQTDYHAWWYTDPPSASHITHDNYHTGFILDALHRWMAVTAESEYQQQYWQGLEFYRDRLFGPNGEPYWMSTRTFPFDIHGAAQGIITFSRHDDLYPGLADRIASWAITNDLSWTARYGLFFPGDAFSDQSSRSFFLTGMTWSF